VNQIRNPFIVKVNIDDTVLEMEIDSGAAISCISRETYYNQFSSYPLSQNYTKLKSYTGHAINPLGYINVKICYKGMLKPIKLYVVEGGGPPLLGRDWLESFKIGFQSINAISKPSEVERVISKFPKVFSGKLGRYKHSKISLELKPDSKPIFCKPRAIPLALKELIDKELDRMIEDKVLNQIETSKWGTPLVPILKNDGTVRLCGDYKTTVNKHLVEINYPLPRIEEMFAKLHGGQHFTKIDLNQAYTQFELDEDAKKLLTWSTHRGLFTVNRMPFGISPASAKFQKYIEQLFMGMKNVINFLDDILITGPTKKEHLETLEKVLKKLDEAGLTVKTFKNKIKVLLLDEKCNRENINTLISRFLISYRNTKHAITKETPAKLLIGRDLRTRLSFLKEGKDDQREIEKVKSENAQKLHRRFKVGDVVMARDYRTINKRTWTEAKILKQLGRTTYICRTKSGEDWKRHANQLIHTTLKADIPVVTETKNSPSRITTSSDGSCFANMGRPNMGRSVKL
jgi:hypothetical protein